MKYDSTCAILIASGTIGGAERYLVELAIAMKRSSMQPVYINLKSDVAYREAIEAHNIALYSNIAEHRMNPLGMIRLLQLIGQLSPDVLLINSSRQAMWLGAIVGRLCRIPLILIHTHEHLSRKINEIRTISSWTNGVIVASDSHQSLFCRSYGFDPAFVRTVYPGIELNRTRNSRYSQKSRPDDKPVVGIIAALRPEKDHENFLQAASIVQKRIPKVHFKIVGDGERSARLQALAGQLGLNQAVEFTGWRTVDRTLFSELDIMVLSSVRETFPAAIIEAFSAGVPVVATDVGSIGELLQGQHRGLMVPPRDPAALAAAIIRLLENRSYAVQLAQNALGGVEFYSADRFCKDMIDAFEDLSRVKRGLFATRF